MVDFCEKEELNRKLKTPTGNLVLSQARRGDTRMNEHGPHCFKKHPHASFSKEVLGVTVGGRQFELRAVLVQECLHVLAAEDGIVVTVEVLDVLAKTGLEGALEGAVGIRLLRLVREEENQVKSSGFINI